MARSGTGTAGVGGVEGVTAPDVCEATVVKPEAAVVVLSRNVVEAFEPARGRTGDEGGLPDGVDGPAEPLLVTVDEEVGAVCAIDMTDELSEADGEWGPA